MSQTGPRRAPGAPGAPGITAATVTGGALSPNTSTVSVETSAAVTLAGRSERVVSLLRRDTAGVVSLATSRRSRSAAAVRPSTSLPLPIATAGTGTGTGTGAGLTGARAQAPASTASATMHGRESGWRGTSLTYPPALSAGILAPCALSL